VSFISERRPFAAPYQPKRLTGPNGQTAWVRTIWIILTGEIAARLVTLIPAEKP